MMASKDTVYIVFGAFFGYKGQPLEQVSSILTSKKDARELVESYKKKNNYTKYYILKLSEII